MLCIVTSIYLGLSGKFPLPDFGVCACTILILGFLGFCGLTHGPLARAPICNPRILAMCQMPYKKGQILGTLRPNKEEPGYDSNSGPILRAHETSGCHLHGPSGQSSGIRKNS